MDETPSDSGVLANSAVQDDSMAPLIESAPPEAAGPTPAGLHLPTGDELGQIVRRPAVWGLLLLIAVVLVVQIWLLFL